MIDVRFSGAGTVGATYRFSIVGLGAVYSRKKGGGGRGRWPELHYIRFFGMLLRSGTLYGYAWRFYKHRSGVT